MNERHEWIQATFIIHTISIFSSLRNVVTETAYAKVLKMDECLCSTPHVLVPNSLGPSWVWKRDSKYLAWFWFKLINSDCVIVRIFWEIGFILFYLISLELGKATHCSFQSFKFSLFSWFDLIMPVKKCCVQWNWCHVSFIVISCNYTIRANALKEHMHTKHTYTHAHLSNLNDATPQTLCTWGDMYVCAWMVGVRCVDPYYIFIVSGACTMTTIPNLTYSTVPKFLFIIPSFYAPRPHISLSRWFHRKVHFYI